MDAFSLRLGCSLPPQDEVRVTFQLARWSCFMSGGGDALWDETSLT